MVHIRIRQSVNDTSLRDIFVVSKQGLEGKVERNMSDAFTTERRRQNEIPSVHLGDTSGYIQRLPKTPIEPHFVVEFEDLGVKYVLLHENGVTQWYFDNNSTDNFMGLPPNAPICYHGFFDQDLVPVTINTVKDLLALHSTLGLDLPCKGQLTHKHFVIHIYLKLDMAMCGPTSANTKYMSIATCEHTALKDLFQGAGGKAAAKDEHLLRNFSWGDAQQGKRQTILMTGTPFSYGVAKGRNITVNKCGWAPDDGVVWLYPCKLTKVKNLNPKCLHWMEHS